MTEPEKEIIKDCEEKGILIYHGFQRDIRLFMKKSHCTVHPSYYAEGMSNVLLESCSAGRPIITTDRPGCREVVEDVVTGYLVKSKDLDDLKKKMITFINLPFAKKNKRWGTAREKRSLENSIER